MLGGDDVDLRALAGNPVRPGEGQRGPLDQPAEQSGADPLVKRRKPVGVQRMFVDPYTLNQLPPFGGTKEFKAGLIQIIKLSAGTAG